jgi:outer membrane biosynthesis protein TonB
VNRLHSKISVLALACFVSSTAAFAQPGSFYSNLLARGVSDALAGNTASALTELRIAAFGLLDSVPEYETAQVYLAVLNERAGFKDLARAAVTKFLMAEKIAPTYARLSLDPTIKREFETLRAQYEQAISTTPASAPRPEPVSPSNQPPKSEPRPQPVAPAPVRAVPPAAPPTPAPAPAQPARPALDPIAANLQSAQERLRANDDASARRYALQVLAADPQNAGAHEVLGVVASHAGQWADVISHFSDLRTRRKLTDDQNTMLFVAYVNSGRFADARAARRLLKPAGLSWPPAQAAIRTLDEQTPPPPPATPQTAAPVTPPAAPASKPAVAVPVPAQPATRPATAAQRPSQTATPAAPPQQTVSPLVAASRHKPSARLTSVSTEVTQAQQLLNEGKIIAARDLFISLSELTDVPRSAALAIGRGLNQTSAYHESSVQYYKVQPFQKGEELHMFTEAVNRYELGDMKTARELLARALPALEQTRDVTFYKSRIEAGR